MERFEGRRSKRCKGKKSALREAARGGLVDGLVRIRLVWRFCQQRTVPQDSRYPSRLLIPTTNRIERMEQKKMG